MTDRAESLGSRTFRFEQTLDSTTISLCLSLFPWAKFRRAKGGVNPSCWTTTITCPPTWRKMQTPKSWPRIVMDRAYNDYRQFARWTDGGVYFVRRLRRRIATFNR